MKGMRRRTPVSVLVGWLTFVLTAAAVAACACAYPLYKRILRRGREKHAEEILRLGDELLGGKERSENDDAPADADGGED